jgi:hypothetical protein
MDSDMKTDRLKFHNQCCLLQRFGYFFVLYLCLSSCNALLFMFFCKIENTKSPYEGSVCNFFHMCILFHDQILCHINVTCSIFLITLSQGRVFLHFI